MMTDIKTIKHALWSLDLWYAAAENQRKQNRWLLFRTKGLISHDRHLRGDYDGSTTILK